MSSQTEQLWHAGPGKKESARWRGEPFCAAWLLLFVLTVLPAPGVRAQEKRADWKELDKQAEKLFEQGGYSEAEVVAKKEVALTEAVFGADSIEVASALDRLGEAYLGESDFAAAETVLKRASAIQEKKLGPEHVDVARSLKSLGNVVRAEGNYAEAEPLFQRALKIRQKALGAEDPEVAAAMDALGDWYADQSQYSEAEPLFKSALAIQEKKLGLEDPVVAGTLNSLGNLYAAQDKFAEAEELHKRALAIGEKALGAEHPDLAVYLTSLAEVYRQEGKYAQAEPLYLRAVDIFKKLRWVDHPEVAETLNDLALLYAQEGRYAQSEPLLEQVLAVEEKLLGPDHRDVARVMANLGEVYNYEGKLSDSALLAEQALAIDEKVLGPDHTDLGIRLSNLAETYSDLGRYAEAEPLVKRAIRLEEKAMGPGSTGVAVYETNLASIYVEQGKYPEAEACMKRSVEIWEKAGPEHPELGTALNNLGHVYNEQRRYAEAEPLLRRSLAVYEKALGAEHPYVSWPLNNLAGMYLAEEKYAEAEPMMKRSLAIDEKALGPVHPEVAVALGSLAMLYNDEGRYSEAEPLLRRALSIDEKNFGPGHPNVGTRLSNLATMYYAQGEEEVALPYFDRTLENLSRQFEYHFRYMSEKDRLAFLSRVKSTFSLYYSFCLTYGEKRPELVGKMYDVALWQKGFVAASVAAMRAKIAASGDKESLALLDKLSAKKTQLAALLTQQPVNREEWRKTVEQLEAESAGLEEELVRRSGALAEEKKLSGATWRDVRDSLRDGEAAVEFLKFPFNDGKKWTKKYRYVALVVTAGSKEGPTLVSLDQGTAEEKGPLNDYRKRVGLERRTGLKDRPGFYETYWKPLETALSGKRRVYVSPDGILNQVALGVVTDEAGQLLLERYDLRIVSSTKDILREKQASAPRSAVLIGNPAFSLGIEREREMVKEVGGNGVRQDPELAKVAMVALELPPIVTNTKRGLARGGCPGRSAEQVLCPLPGTQREIEAIQETLRARGWDNESAYVGEKALKEVLLKVQHPRVLHIATHGYFDADAKKGAIAGEDGTPAAAGDPMLRSGLFLAGADRTLKGETIPAGLDNGVLTAYEASTLDLQGTELVVLSACDTGLGEVQNGEGVFGLKRALEEAGAESVLMTMWAVPDKETQELMTGFYANWLSGMEKAEALRQAQLAEREIVIQRYGKDDPSYWGAFVLTGNN
jgi:CHAT domain-containing protein/Tfp pilus assembly protein PilF